MSVNSISTSLHYTIFESVYGGDRAQIDKLCSLSLYCCPQNAMMKDKKVFDSGFTLYDVVEKALIKLGTVNPKVEGRIVEVK
ncbi:hypothetical protein NBRC13296_25745 [Paenibacillus chitinolyticus]|uniref:hypothetical protein n=1 Tax=Paenibacillus chitinolyticus TaxID=79263 RepID=UPI0035580A99